MRALPHGAADGETDIMDSIEKLEALVATAREEADKFYAKGNKAAGTRLRKAMQDIKGLAQDIRVDVQNSKNA